MTTRAQDDDVNDSDARRVATENCVLLTQVGSTVHGVGVNDQDDRDELGICVEPPEYVIGLRRFEQYEQRTQPQGVRSGPGDLDRVVYSLRKWTRLAVQGNPSILIPLFVPITDVVYATSLGVDLRADPSWLLSRQAGLRFLGYLDSQRRKLRGERGTRLHRPELIERYGFDTKFAYHMVRLGLQGVELLRTGRLTLPMPEPDRSWLRALRVGEHTLAEALTRAEELEHELRRLVNSPTLSSLRDRPDHAVVNEFLVRSYESHWWEESRYEHDDE